MTTLATSFEGGTPGAAISTTINGGDAFATGVTGTGAGFDYANDQPAAIADGALAAKLTLPATATNNFRQWNLTGTATPSIRMYKYLTSYMAGGVTLAQLLAGTTNRARVRLSATGQVSVLNNTTNVAETTAAIPLNTLVRIESSFGLSTTGTGTATVSWYLGHSTTPSGTASASALTFNGATVDAIRLGLPLNGANWSYYTDGWAVSDSGPIGPLVAATSRVLDRWNGSALVRQKSEMWNGTALTTRVLEPAGSEAEPPPDDALVIDGNFQSYAVTPPYSAYTGMWGHYIAANNDLIADSSMTIYPDTFPNGSSYSWSVTRDPDWGGVVGILGVSYGNYDDSPFSITPRQVNAITTLSANLSWTFTGDQSSGLLCEFWLSSASTPSGEITTKTHEIAFWPKVSAGSQAYANSSTTVGPGFTASGVTWVVKEDVSNTGEPYLFAYRTGFADFEGVLPFKAYLDYLTAQGKITGNEWFNGLVMGVEPFDGAGTLTLDTFSVSYS